MANLSRERPLNMTEYILKQDAVDAIHEFPMFMECNEIYIYQKRIEKIPAADVAPVVHGKWIYDPEAYPMGSPYGHYNCDQCGESVPNKTNFCPNCGADMRGKQDD